MRGRSLRCRGPRPGLNERVNRGSRYPIHRHMPVAEDGISGFLTEARFLVANENGILVDSRNNGTRDTPIPLNFE